MKKDQPSPALFSKTDTMLDIPKKTLDIENYKANLKKGTCKTLESKSGINLLRLHSNQIGQGFGTSKFREIVEKSIELGCPGKISTSITTEYGTPHLFYLYMGMVPETQPCSYIKYYFGAFSMDALDDLEQCSGDIKKLSKDTQDDLKRILCKQLSVSRESITLDDIIKHKDLLLKLKERTIDYIGEIFIPVLLEVLKDNPQDKYPDTKILGCVNMVLSKKAFERWNYVIKNNLEFYPFKNLEHINLSSSQKKILDEIIAERQTACVKKLG